MIRDLTLNGLGSVHRSAVISCRRSISAHNNNDNVVDDESQLGGNPRIYQVAIVGGGPTGLLLSNLLSQYEISHILLESKSAESSFQHPQAHFINTRTMEILRSSLPSVYERVIQTMPPVEEYEQFCFGHSMMDPKPLATVLHPLRYPLQVDQDANGILLNDSESDAMTEKSNDNLEKNALSPCRVGHLAQHRFARILYDHAIESKQNFGHLEFGTKVNSIHLTNEGRLLRVETTQQTNVNPKTFHANVCIAADGASSSFRQAQLQGNFSEQFLMNIHVRLSPDQYNQLPHHSMLFTSLNENVISMVVLHSRGEYVLQVPYFPPYQDPQVDFTSEKVEKLVSSVFGLAIGASQIQSVRPWTMKAWIASQYHNRQGLAWIGDAAHVFPPAGGFGMNTGLQDAHNLAWKLCTLFRREAKHKHINDQEFLQLRNNCLSSYEGERRPVAMENAALSVRNYNRVLSVMNQCYLNHKHPELLKTTLDASSSLVPLSTRQGIFRSLMQTALQPLAMLDPKSKTAQSPPQLMYRQHIQTNLQRLFQQGGGLPLLFPRFEIGFSYTMSDEQKQATQEDYRDQSSDTANRKSDTWADEDLRQIRVGHRLPHAFIRPCASRLNQDDWEWSTIDLPMRSLDDEESSSQPSRPSWVILVVGQPETKPIQTTKEQMELIRKEVEKWLHLDTLVVYLFVREPEKSSLDRFQSRHKEYCFTLKDSSNPTFSETEGVALIRPDGHVAQWIQISQLKDNQALKELLNNLPST